MKSNEDRCRCRVIHPDRLETARRSALGRKEVEKVSRIFKALGDASRLKILTALEQEEMCVCDLAALVEITESAVSHQLRLLRTLRLVTNRREGTVLYYRLADAHVGRLVDLALDHVRE